MNESLICVETEGYFVVYNGITFDFYMGLPHIQLPFDTRGILTQQKQHSSTDTVLLRFSRANGNNTVTPPSVQTVTVCSVVGTLYTDFKNGTVLFTVKLRITDRPSPSLYRPSGASSVKVP